MEIDVDIPASVEAGRIKARSLTPRQWFSAFMDVSMSVLLLVTCLFMFYLARRSFSEDEHVPLITVLLYSISALIFVVVLFGFYQDNKLSNVVGGSADINRQFIVDILKKRYKIRRIASSDKMLIYHKRATYATFGMRIIILFEGDEVFLNISRFNYRGSKSFFHGISSSIRTTSILNEFRSKFESAIS